VPDATRNDGPPSRVVDVSPRRRLPLADNAGCHHLRRASNGARFAGKSPQPRDATGVHRPEPHVDEEPRRCATDHGGPIAARRRPGPRKIEEVRPWELLGKTEAPDGTTMALTRRSGEYVILAGGESLMSSRMHGSEEALATLGCQAARLLHAPRVLVGGLGMGFTLRAALNLLPPAAIVTVSEMVPAVVAWNRGPLGPLAHHPLDDPRVRVDPRDVVLTMRDTPAAFDAVLLDVDNGPAPFTSDGNVGVYDDTGIAIIARALRPDGALAVWSARDDRRFEQRLRYGGFRVAVERVRGRGRRGGPMHVIFIARREP
jgi:spermidine synthase